MIVLQNLVWFFFHPGGIPWHGENLRKTLSQRFMSNSFKHRRLSQIPLPSSLHQLLCVSHSSLGIRILPRKCKCVLKHSFLEFSSTSVRLMYLVHVYMYIYLFLRVEMVYLADNFVLIKFPEEIWTFVCFILCNFGLKLHTAAWNTSTIWH